jgi:hypothetical protein
MPINTAPVKTRAAGGVPRKQRQQPPRALVLVLVLTAAVDWQTPPAQSLVSH